ncbi:hypothetical protein [Bacillus xiapuensis]|uniref:Uncharacterized protein n=1 Tax=Bacillus xiapuensis TaxID=2014075 RepID=A0ABU6NAM7_9BACI|nr:hypothetical protein [Bacillus xiapuensis]
MMKIVKIDFPTSLSSLEDIEDDNIDVFVELDDGYSYTIVVTTPKNLISMMESEGIEYNPALPPMVIVKKLTEENIKNALETYLENQAYWLKYYFLAGEINIELMNEMLRRIKMENDDLLG